MWRAQARTLAVETACRREAHAGARTEHAIGYTPLLTSLYHGQSHSLAARCKVMAVPGKAAGCSVGSRSS